jgi:hypothetical protein
MQMASVPSPAGARSRLAADQLQLLAVAIARSSRKAAAGGDQVELVRATASFSGCAVAIVTSLTSEIGKADVRARR